MKCFICKQEMEKSFLNKIKGTYVKINGKKRTICNKCQKEHNEDLKEKLRQIFK